MLFSRFFMIIPALFCGQAISEPIYISMVNLIAFPERYVGVEVMVTGFNSQRVLYLTEEAARYRDTANGIYFEDKRQGLYDHCEDKHVHIEGKIVTDFSGGIVLQDVSSVYSLDDHAQCEISPKHEYSVQSK